MGKSTLLSNLILDDIHQGRGCCLIDPHGDLAEFVLERIPKHRTHHVLYINPQADFSSYENVIIDPVAVWQGEGSSFSGVSPGELESLARDPQDGATR